MFNTIVLVCINLYSALGGNSAVYLLLANLIVVLCTALAVVIGHIKMVVKHVKIKPQPLSNLVEHAAISTNLESPRVTMSVVSISQNTQSTNDSQPIENSNEQYSMSRLREPLLDECD